LQLHQLAFFQSQAYLGCTLHLTAILSPRLS
jgi:hypothetical protein